MNWTNVSVWQMQQISNLLSKNEGDTSLDIAVKTLAILTNRTEAQIDSLGLDELSHQIKDIAFLNESQPNAKPQDYIKVNGKKYKCIYDIRNMPYARYMETKFFGNDVINNLHKIGASMVMPMKKTWFGWKIDQYDASKHEEYANDLLEASYESVYGSVVFFCQVYVQSINNLADYLKEKIVAKGMTKEEAETTTEILCNVLDGFTKLPSLQNTKESNSKKFTGFLQFNV
jgi:hypothetical protein